MNITARKNEGNISDDINIHNIFTDLSPDGIVAFDGTNRLVYANPAFLEMANFTWKQLDNLEMYEFDTHIHELSDLNRKINTNNTTFVRLDQAAKKTLRCVRHHFCNDRDKWQVLYFQDVTNSIEEKRPALNSQFLSTAAHCLRTPLVSIIGFSELLLKRDFNTEKCRHMIETIFQQTSRYKRLLDNFMDIIQIEIDDEKIFDMEIDTLENIFIAVYEETGITYNDKNIVFNTPEHWPIISRDTEKIQGALNILITSFVKYSPDGNIICDAVARKQNNTEEFGFQVKSVGQNMILDEKGLIIEINLLKKIAEAHKGKFETEDVAGVLKATLWLPVVAV